MANSAWPAEQWQVGEEEHFHNAKNVQTKDKFMTFLLFVLKYFLHEMLDGSFLNP